VTQQQQQQSDVHEKFREYSPISTRKGFSLTLKDKVDMNCLIYGTETKKVAHKVRQK